MQRYFLRRLILTVPTLLLVSLMAFWLQEAAPGDPVSRFIRDDPMAAEMPEGDRQFRVKAYVQAARELGFDLPPFYFGIRPASLPDTLHRLLPLSVRKAWRDLCLETGNPAVVARWFAAVDQAEASLSDYAGDPAAEAALRQVRLCRLAKDLQGARHLLDEWPAGHHRTELMALERALPGEPRFAWRNLLPVPEWHGAQNRYHQWMRGFFSPRGQRSWQDARPVWSKISAAARWTLLMNILAIALAYGLSIPLGVWMASRAGTPREGAVSVLLYALYSVPAFWLGTLSLVFLTNPVYGMHWFPAVGLGDVPPDAGWWEVFYIRGSHLALPVFCLTYGSLAYLTRQVRNAMVRELSQEYIRTAWAKGLPARRVLWGHAFRNARYTLITLLAYVLPAALAGSVAIEVIFTIPGMGRLTWSAILAQDWPVVYGVLFLAALLTLAGSLLADLLYSLADPRVRLGK